ncbi:unnamed protein product [Durusdinium trenchii]|uniref:Inner centromere protein ARK-binding domain-containing protein n=1 Tax=Durusdinium trenchii TaxID=1381693 RepID=A0ABP0QEX5_9DINO
MKWHFLTAAQCFVHAVVIYRRGLHEGQRDQFVDAPNGLTAELPADGWQEQAVLCGEEDANPGETVPLRSKRGRKGKEWQSCEVIDAEKEKSLRICALDWLAKKAIIHDKLLLGSVGFRARFWSIFHFPVFETESFFLSCQRSSSSRDTKQWRFSWRKRTARMEVEMTGDHNEKPMKKIKRVHAKKYGQNATASRALMQMERDGAPQDHRPASWQLKNFRRTDPKTTACLLADSLGSLRSFAQSPPENVVIDESSVLLTEDDATQEDFIENLFDSVSEPAYEALRQWEADQLNLALQRSLEENEEHKREVEASNRLIDGRLRRAAKRTLSVLGYGNCQFSAVIESAKLAMSVGQLRSEVVKGGSGQEQLPLLDSMTEADRAELEPAVQEEERTLELEPANHQEAERASEADRASEAESAEQEAERASQPEPAEQEAERASDAESAEPEAERASEAESVEQEVQQPASTDPETALQAEPAEQEDFARTQQTGSVSTFQIFVGGELLITADASEAERASESGPSEQEADGTLEPQPDDQEAERASESVPANQEVEEAALTLPEAAIESLEVEAAPADQEERVVAAPDDALQAERSESEPGQEAERAGDFEPADQEVSEPGQSESSADMAALDMHLSASASGGFNLGPSALEAWQGNLRDRIDQCVENDLSSPEAQGRPQALTSFAAEDDDDLSDCFPPAVEESPAELQAEGAAAEKVTVALSPVPVFLGAEAARSQEGMPSEWTGSEGELSKASSSCADDPQRWEVEAVNAIEMPESNVVEDEGRAEAAEASKAEESTTALDARIDEGADERRDEADKASETSEPLENIEMDPTKLRGAWRGESVSPERRTNSEALWHILRTKPLRPPKSEDNYDMSSAGDPDMTEEERAQHELDLEDRRVTKQSPRWCENYLELVHQQKDWDPDTVFGEVPPCDLDSVFPDALYMELNLQRTYKKRRGSSANWKKDQLKPDEMANYKRKLGLKKAFVPETDASLLMEQGEMRRLNKTATDKPSKSRKSKNKRQGEVPAICQFE